MKQLILFTLLLAASLVLGGLYVWASGPHPRSTTYEVTAVKVGNLYTALRYDTQTGESWYLWRDPPQGEPVTFEWRAIQNPESVGIHE